MRTLDQLINAREPAWTLVQEWVTKAKNKVEILPRDTTRANEALYQTQVKAVPIEELYSYTLEMQKKLQGKK